MLALKAENISKQYRLGQVGTGTLSHDLNRFWYRIRGKEDPYLKIGEENDRSSKGMSEYVWSLRDINFEIEQGDAVGIIGRNGAGKSTLLKLLSKVTKPTTGKIYSNGRIASLLEVGTGFHPEMTGRENIYLNGAILGMTRREIKRKFDEIVDFSGVERYIDTPVKRYSSGMYVRLAFAVAAHLESEILIVDEVLAVGDAEFQKKCLGKMGDVSKGEGRTVLFVSHDMTAVNRLCNNAISLKNGMLYSMGEAESVISEYILSNYQSNVKLLGEKKVIEVADTGIKIQDVCFRQKHSKTNDILQGEPFEVAVEIANLQGEEEEVLFNFELKDFSGNGVTCFGNEFQRHDIILESESKKEIIFGFDENILREGQYYVSVYVCLPRVKKSVYMEECLTINSIKALESYFIDPNRKWNYFSRQSIHGYFPIDVDHIIQNNK
ncbi:polysaccharide ABC transporter ATP-binding protein [Riemerella anatipestifer]|nr:polysaccharide ABC transporter ATP-binding protein [Riemerella anatipestifer]MDY3528264.1 polysaccharide ABC transporter ATP-binding protein [Riemerella anatipestifer]